MVLLSVEGLTAIKASLQDQNPGSDGCLSSCCRRKWTPEAQTCAFATVATEAVQLSKLSIRRFSGRAKGKREAVLV